ENRASKRPKLNVDARCLTSREGMELAEKQHNEREAEVQKKNEAQAARDAKDAERQEIRRTMGPTTVFTGSLNSKLKDDLKDIAFVLGLSLEGNKDELILSIKSHFGSHPNLSEDPRYRGLFGRTRTTLAAPPHPPASTLN
ncbi:uncharacterized protein C8R40DRAFT_1026638, partial [Lentinula edodes]|uniref:uncharacterized protein n=1 Tax=Lentinula edodes TaxID=5353 RepID=UPI001E8EAD9B